MNKARRARKKANKAKGEGLPAWVDELADFAEAGPSALQDAEPEEAPPIARP